VLREEEGPGEKPGPLFVSRHVRRHDA